jgi:hypothetical protein
MPRIPRFIVLVSASLIGPPMMKKMVSTPMRLSVSPTNSLPLIIAIVAFLLDATADERR